MLSLPSSSSNLRNLFEVSTLVEIAAPANRSKLPTFRDAVSSARKLIASGAHSVNVICVTADGNLRLVQVGNKGGIKRLWKFGAI